MTSAISSPQECKTLLAVDTSGPEGSLAIASFASGQIQDLKQVEWKKKSAHSEVITLELQNLLQLAGVELKNLTHIAVNTGPGSFTGLRIGISLAKALAYSLSLEVMSVNSLELLASRVPSEGEVFIASKAIQKFYYAARFNKTADDIEVLAAPHAISQSEIPSSTNVWAEAVTADFSVATKAEDIVRFVQKYSCKRMFLPWKSVEPLYVRGSEAEEKLKAGLLKPV